MREGARAGWLTSALAAILLAGCPQYTRPPEPDPVAAVVAYRDALVEGRPADAFALIHPDAREGLDEAGFGALYKRHRETLVAQAEGLVVRARATLPEQRATVRAGDTVSRLLHTAEGWRLLKPVGAVPSEAP